MRKLGLQEKVEKAVVEYLGTDGVCSTQELHKFLETKFNLSYSQATGRIHQLVQSGTIENFERGSYKVGTLKKLVHIFSNIQKEISGFNPSLSEFINYNDRDKEALKELESIKNIVSTVLEMYKVGDSY